jgi:hypothetical protein
VELETVIEKKMSTFSEYHLNNAYYELKPGSKIYELVEPAGKQRRSLLFTNH